MNGRSGTLQRDLPIESILVASISRREFLARATAVAAVVCARPAAASADRTKLILLGTGGGPRPRTASSGSAQVIVSNNVAYVVDCGDGVARQLVFAGIPLTTLRHVFITHQHSDPPQTTAT